MYLSSLSKVWLVYSCEILKELTKPLTGVVNVYPAKISPSVMSDAILDCGARCRFTQSADATPAESTDRGSAPGRYVPGNSEYGAVPTTIPPRPTMTRAITPTTRPGHCLTKRAHRISIVRRLSSIESRLSGVIKTPAKQAPSAKNSHSDARWDTSMPSVVSRITRVTG